LGLAAGHLSHDTGLSAIVHSRLTPPPFQRWLVVQIPAKIELCKGVTGIYARWHMFEEKRDAVMAIEAAVPPLMP
jgi:hypothetical protein